LSDTGAGTKQSRLFALPKFLSGEHPFPWLLPATAMMVVFGVYPLIYAIWISLHKRNAATRVNVWDPTYNGIRALSDDRVWNALFNTLTYTSLALIIQLVLGMGIALLLDSDRKGYGVLRALMTLPLVVPPAVTAMMYLLMLDGSFGVLSRSLYALHLLSPAKPILANSATALPGVLLADIWQWTPFMVLIMMAGLRSLPKEPFEAAAIDGATSIQAFFRLTLPMMSRVIAIAVLIRGIDMFRIFDYVKVMTDSGPGTATETLTSYSGRIYFSGEFPYASTLALLTLIFVILISTAFMKLFRVRL
jgi:multiple sugar transport system permease protein